MQNSMINSSGKRHPPAGDGSTTSDKKKKKSKQSKQIILKCDYCSYETPPLTKRHAEKRLLEHMQRTTPCQNHIKQCPNCSFLYFRESSFTQHLGQKAACNSFYHINLTNERELMAISESETYRLDDMARRNNNIIRRTLIANSAPENSGNLISKPIGQSKEEGNGNQLTHRMLVSENDKDNYNRSTFSVHESRTIVEDKTLVSSKKFDEMKEPTLSATVPKPSSYNLNEIAELEHDNFQAWGHDDLSKEEDSGKPASSEMVDWEKYLLSLRTHNNTADFTAEESAFIELMEILEKNDIPFSIFDRIAKWSKKNHSKINPISIVTREGIKKAMQRKVHGKLHNRMSPTSEKVTLPSGNKVQIPIFDIKYQLVQKLIDPSLMRQENMLIDLKDPFKKNDFTDSDMLGDVNTGMWHKITQEKLCRGENDILCPLIFFIDGTTIDKLGKQSIEPVSVTMAIFNRKTRNLAHSWFHLGAIENHTNISKYKKSEHKDDGNDNQVENANVGTPLQRKKKRKKNKAKTAEEKAKDYHFILSAILQPLKNLQKEGGFRWFLPNKDLVEVTSLPGTSKDDWTEVNMIVPVQFVIGDTEGHDKLCCKQGGHETTHLMRDCNVKMVDGANWEHKCVYYTNDTIQSLYEKNLLKTISFYQMRNPWWDVEMGGDGGGIYKATYHEILHQFHSGIVENIIDEINNLFNQRALDLLDKNICMMAPQLSRQSASSNYPSVRSFRKGMNPGNVTTASEKMGRLLIVYLAMLRSDVASFLIAHGHKKSFPPISREYYLRIILLLERTLGVHSFLKSEYIDRSLVRPSNFIKDQEGGDVFIKQEFEDSDEAPVSKSFRTYMKHLQEIFPRQQATVFKVFQVKKNDLIYFNGSNQGKRYEWLVEHDLLLDDIELSKRKNPPERCAKNAMKLLNVDKVVQMFGYEVSVRGNGWNIPKFHAFLHLTRPISYNGVPENYNGARSESILIENIKKPARRTNKHNATMTYQAMLRYSEQRTRSVAYSVLHDEQTEGHTYDLMDEDEHYQDTVQDNISPGIIVSGSRIVIEFVRTNSSNDGYCVSKWSRRNNSEITEIPKATLDYLGKRVFTQLHLGGGKLLPDEELICRTELRIRDTMIRCHPNYKSDGEWYDWVTIKWEGYLEPIPAKVLLIIDLRKSKFYSDDTLKRMFPDTYKTRTPNESLVNSVYLLVKSASDGRQSEIACLSNDTDEFYSRLSGAHTIENDGLYRLINVNMVVKPSILVMEDYSSDKKNLIVVSGMESWSAKSFLQPISQREDDHFNCSNNNGVVQPYYTKNIPDHRVRYLCNNKNQICSRGKHKIVLYRNELNGLHDSVTNGT